MTEESDSAVQKWKIQVSSHHAQSIAAQENFDPSRDFWEGMTGGFIADPFRQNDLVLDRLLVEFSECQSVLDVGGGAGRFALALSVHGKDITVVDASQSMLSELKKSCSSFKISEIKSVLSEWEQASVKTHDGVLCSHVAYGVEDIETFINNIICHTNKHVVFLLFNQSPQAHLAESWELVHKEKRINLPGADELMPVLNEMGISPKFSVIQSLSIPIYESKDAALSDLRSRLYVNKGSVGEQKLKSSFDTLFAVNEEGFYLKNAPVKDLCIVQWRA